PPVDAHWTQELLDHAFQESQIDPSTIFLDSFGRRVFRYKDKIINYGKAVHIQEAQVLSFIRNSGLDIPVPLVYSSGMCDKTGFIEMEMIEGDTLHNIWGGLSEEEKHRYTA
ncbi:hypothetical protein A1O3_08436, partial [Capronia epimyces CBS 606.96]